MDERLREAERRWRSTGSVEDEVAWLRERLRTGALAPAVLARAVAMNHPPARAVVGAPPREECIPSFLLRWGAERARALDPIPGDPCVRCWGGSLEDALEPPPPKGPFYSPNGEDFDWVMTSGDYALRCAACGARFTGVGSRKFWVTSDRVDHDRAFTESPRTGASPPPPPTPAPATPTPAPAPVPPPAGLWQRVRTWFGAS